MAVSQAPEVGEFTYCLIPANGGTVVEHTFTGKSDEELREGLNSYFCDSSALTDGQKAEFVSNMKDQVKENAKKGAYTAGKPAPEVDDNLVTDEFINSAMGRQGGFEIVPMIYPDSSNGYRGLSLYIDQVGRFKDLPLNERASKLAQRDIRGDAFAIASYDDPVKDNWARISVTKDRLDELITLPPERAADPQARAAAMQASLETKLITQEDMCKARDFKAGGNTLFQKGNFDEAIAQYAEGMTHLRGRADEVDAAEWKSLSTTLFLNRAQAYLKLGRPRDAEGDCTTVLQADPTSLKAYYRRATARRTLGEFDAALGDLAAAKEQYPTDDSILKLTAAVCDSDWFRMRTRTHTQIEAEKQKHKAAEKARFSKMFA